METDPLAVWLYHGLRQLGVPIDYIHARHVHAALATQLNKTDANDAYGIAQLTHTGWYRPVEVKSMASYKVRLLLRVRHKLVGLRTTMYNQIRSTLKTFGVVLPAGKGMAFKQLVLSQTPCSSLTQHVIHALLDTWCHLNLQIRDFDKAITRLASASHACQQLMTVPSVGSLTAVAFASAVDRSMCMTRPDTATVLAPLECRLDDYNESHPQKGLKIKSPREFIRVQSAAGCPIQ